MVLVDFPVENACSPPRLEQTLLLTNSSTTPIDLIHNISSGKPTDAEKSEIDDLSFLRETLQNAGYTPLEVETAILAYIDKQKEGIQYTYDKNIPRTQVFAHGKVYTYDEQFIFHFTGICNQTSLKKNMVTSTHLTLICCLVVRRSEPLDKTI